MKRFPLLPLTALLSCSSFTASDRTRHIGIIGDDQYGSIRFHTRLEMPDTVSMGAPFEVRFQTIGENLCAEADESTIEQSGLTADITPYDLSSSGICQDMLKALPRTLTLRFLRRGTATVRLHGMLFGETGAMGVLERTVVVR